MIASLHKSERCSGLKDGNMVETDVLGSQACRGKWSFLNQWRNAAQKAYLRLGRSQVCKTVASSFAAAGVAGCVQISGRGSDCIQCKAVCVWRIKSLAGFAWVRDLLGVAVALWSPFCQPNSTSGPLRSLKCCPYGPLLFYHQLLAFPCPSIKSRVEPGQRQSYGSLGREN